MGDRLVNGAWGQDFVVGLEWERRMGLYRDRV